MKTAIITLHAVQNYGSVLQAYATQKVFNECGIDNFIINYIKEDNKKENLLYEWCGNSFIKKLAMIPTLKRWEKIYDTFRKDNLVISEHSYTTMEDFEKNPVIADAFCTGSDQVWNSVWNRGGLKPLYLAFAPENSLKFSFSSSFGQEKLGKNEVEDTKDYINQYKYLSVRENSATKILSKQYDRNDAEQIVDPTLAISGEQWKKMAVDPSIKKDYILIYNLNRSKEFDEYAKKLSRKTGLKLVRLCNRYDQFYRPGKSIFAPTVFEFIGWIKNAKYVLTDSFHGTAFAINMHVLPICVYPKSFSSRIDSFLKLTNCLQRKVIDYNDFDVINRLVDFTSIEKILSEERTRVRKYLHKVKEG